MTLQLRLGRPEDAEYSCSLVSDVSGVIQRAPLGHHGCVFDEDLDGKAAATLADEHALQFIAFPIGLDDQRSRRMQRSMAIVYGRARERTKVGRVAGSSQKATLSQWKGDAVSDEHDLLLARSRDYSGPFGIRGLLRHVPLLADPIEMLLKREACQLLERQTRKQIDPARQHVERIAERSSLFFLGAKH